MQWSFKVNAIPAVSRSLLNRRLTALPICKLLCSARSQAQRINIKARVCCVLDAHDVDVDVCCI